MLTLAFITGCASSNPTMDRSPEAEVTFDGLHAVEGGAADGLWARPGTDISQYSKIMLQGVGIEYRPGGEAGRTFHAIARGGPFEVTAKQREEFEKIMKEAFLEELAKSEYFQLVDEAGPEVLLIRGALIDVVSFVPPELLKELLETSCGQTGSRTGPR